MNFIVVKVADLAAFRAYLAGTTDNAIIQSMPAGIIPDHPDVGKKMVVVPKCETYGNNCSVAYLSARLPEVQDFFNTCPVAEVLAYGNDVLGSYLAEADQLANS